ncbi:hypothetical protein ACIQPQ_20450 [Streptomyces sp. NPDC091281]|uniref:hypothetical protein n=1 Tax=Streptomyces sp. NPDC091281 TaxID=3365985 RepID=UPI0037F53D2C
MTVPPLLSAMGPFGIVANSTASLAYSIVKDLNSSLSFEATSGTPLDAVPDVLKDALVDEDLGEHAVSGLFYTHSRFQPIARQVKHLTGLLHRHRDAVPEAVHHSHSIFMVLPLSMSYTAVRLSTRQAQVQLMNKANESAASVDPVDTDEITRAEERVAQLGELLDGHRYAQDVAARKAFKREREQLLRRIETFKANRKAADRMRVEAGKVRQARHRVYLKNFTIRPLEQVGGVKGRSAAGLRGKGTMVVTPRQMPAPDGGLPRHFVSVQFDWHEDNLLGHSYDWHGRVDLGCDDQGAPVILGGDGKFLERFRQTAVVS